MAKKQILITKAQIELDFNVNSDIKNRVSLSRKLGNETDTKERLMGSMVEDMYSLEQMLKRKKLTMSDLITFINSK